MRDLATHVQDTIVRGPFGPISLRKEPRYEVDLQDGRRKQREKVRLALDEAERDGWTDRDALGRQHGPQVRPSSVSTALSGKGADEHLAFVEVLVGVTSVCQDVVIDRVGDVTTAENRHVEREEPVDEQPSLHQLSDRAVHERPTTNSLNDVPRDLDAA